jgi:glycerophosphoryl diester phosphodiesterase
VILLDPQAKPLIAHRGASGTWPENTLRAFREGLAQGADALELDVRVTRDGMLVVIHDPTVDRTTNGTGVVRELTIPTLRALDAGLGEALPTIDEVLESFPNVPLIVEIKEVAAAGPLALVLRRHAAGNRVLVGAFQRRALGPFKATEVARAASRSETAWAWAASRVGWAPWLASYRAFTVPPRQGRVEVVDERFVDAAARRTRPVHVWTVDDRVEAERLRRLGVGGIITNFPERLRGLPGS